MVVQNNKEAEALVTFRNQVADLIVDPADHFLLRWLRARNLNVTKAEEMLRNYVEWRKNNEDLRNVLNWNPPKPVQDGIQHKFTGFDSEGRPVLWLPIGRWEVRRLLSEGFRPDLIRLQYKILEEISFAVEKQQVHGTNQFVLLADSSQLTFWKLANYETIEMILKFFKEFESYFPELLHSCYIVNNPIVFSYIFNLVKPLLSSHTLSKVQLFDSNDSKWKPILLNALPASAFPVEYGGTAEKVLN